MTKFKIGDCIRYGKQYRESICDSYGKIIDIHKSREHYVIEWCDDIPETTNECFKTIDNGRFIKISDDKLLALAL